MEPAVYGGQPDEPRRAVQLFVDVQRNALRQSAIGVGRAGLPLLGIARCPDRGRTEVGPPLVFGQGLAGSAKRSK